MSKLAWAVIIGLVILLILGVGAALLIPFGARALGFGLARPGILGFGIPFFFARGISMFLFWLLILGGAILIFQSLAHRPTAVTNTVPSIETPLDILKRRYANGEISKEQFEEMKNTLGVG